MLESWYWFWLSETPAVESWKGDHNLGVILGSQQESVLQAENYTNLMPANNVEQLIKQLYAKRVDAILVDQTNFKILAKQMQLKPNSYNSRFFRYVPLGVFFSSKFITQYPDFIGNFNKHIAACAQEPFSLTAAEKNTIKRVAIPYMYRIQHSSPVVQAVNKQNSDLQNKPQAQLLDIDKQWINAANQNKKTFMDTYINRPASNELITIKQASKKLITEIIVMDARGFNVAISDISSDYWQGDESKYQDTINLQENELNIENINYDVSTKLFQVQASAPIIDTKANKNIGVITLGIDVERALSKTE
jgi:hypothetical protein